MFCAGKTAILLPIKKHETWELCAGATHVSTADYPMPMRHSMSEPAVFDEVVPAMNRKIS